MSRQPAERYPPALLELEEEGVVPIRARLCDRFDASHPTVGANVRRLVRAGYVRAGDGRVLELSRVLELTGDGRTLATTLLQNMAERVLAALGVDQATVHRDAERWALVMSDDVAEALSDLLAGDLSLSFD